MDEEKSKDTKLIQATIVDMSGTEQELKIDNVDAKDIGAELPFFNFATEYSQVADGIIVDFAYNSQYYFYIDQEYQLHRWDKGTKEDEIISDKKVMEVQCANDGLYVKEYDKAYVKSYAWLTYNYANTLYFMDFEGGNVKKIAEGKNS